MGGIRNVGKMSLECGGNEKNVGNLLRNLNRVFARKEDKLAFQLNSWGI